MSWPLRNYYDKDMKSDIIDEKSDAGGVAAGGISPENICPAPCNLAQHCFAFYVWSTRHTKVCRVLASKHHCVLS